MFKEIGTMMSLLKNQGKIQEEMQKFQAQIGSITVEGTAGAGYVTVKVNGRMEVLAVRISEEAMQLNDHEMLEDLIASATNLALAKARTQVAEESAEDGDRTWAYRPGCSAADCPGRVDEDAVNDASKMRDEIEDA